MVSKSLRCGYVYAVVDMREKTDTTSTTANARRLLWHKLLLFHDNGHNTEQHVTQKRSTIGRIRLSLESPPRRLCCGASRLLWIRAYSLKCVRVCFCVSCLRASAFNSITIHIVGTRRMQRIIRVHLQVEHNVFRLCLIMNECIICTTKRNVRVLVVSSSVCTCAYERWSVSPLSPHTAMHMTYIHMFHAKRTEELVYCHAVTVWINSRDEPCANASLNRVHCRLLCCCSVATSVCVLHDVRFCADTAMRIHSAFIPHRNATPLRPEREDQRWR